MKLSSSPSQPAMSSSAITSEEGLVESAGRAWNRFWFTPVDPLPCCVLRIAVGLLAAAHLASLGIDLARWYASDGLLPPAAGRSLWQLTTASTEPDYRFSHLNFVPQSTALVAIHAAAIVCAALFAAGAFTRVSGLVTLLLVLAYVHRVPFVAGHLEPVLVYLLAYLCIAPSGSRLSVDALLRRRRQLADPDGLPQDDRERSVAANLGLRLIQVHTAMFVAMMGLTKLYGDAWWNGEAIWILLAQTQSRPLDLSGLRRAGAYGEYLINAWTHAVLYYELAFPVLIWNRVARPLLLALGIVIWASLIVATGLLLFGLTMLVASAAFLPAAAFMPLARPTIKAATSGRGP